LLKKFGDGAFDSFKQELASKGFSDINKSSLTLIKKPGKDENTPILSLLRPIEVSPAVNQLMGKSIRRTHKKALQTL